jgi:hypothetical protein
MSLDKAIQSGKEKRKPYRGAKAVDRSCRDKTCPWCKGNAQHRNRRREPLPECIKYDTKTQTKTKM